MNHKPEHGAVLKEAKVEILKLVIELISKNVDVDAIISIFSLEKIELEQIEGLVRKNIKQGSEWDLNKCGMADKAMKTLDSVRKEQMGENQTDVPEGVNEGRLDKELMKVVKKNVRNPNRRKITAVPVTMKTRLTRENERLIREISSWLE
ncbi:hypothetical protein [Mesobacillus stamsii]|uniref:Uncharacterized protein n=1 Tax=Mesobacillus stamsii TaxID=225347 RepID=A0ABU0FYH1_9BACI|nr:hypothetical protein [Mesobacillus stamsii]MDQ0414991.1 hypothetical protein [Mesobacillus stamsii]